MIPRTNPEETDENSSKYHSVPETGIAGGVGLETAKHVENHHSGKKNREFVRRMWLVTLVFRR